MFISGCHQNWFVLLLSLEVLLDQLEVNANIDKDIRVKSVISIFSESETLQTPIIFQNISHSEIWKINLQYDFLFGIIWEHS